MKTISHARNLYQVEKNLTAAAVEYLNAGLSVIPVNVTDKKPTSSWTAYQTTPLTPEGAEKILWPGIAIIGGRVSGGVECIDFDFKARWFDPWLESVESKAPNLTTRLVIQKTQSGGRHVVYRHSGTPARNDKLACKRLAFTGEGEHEYDGFKFTAVSKANGKFEVRINGKSITARREGEEWAAYPCLIETRAEGGYFLVAPTPGYEIQAGNFLALPVLTAEERTVLIDAARALDERPKKRRPLDRSIYDEFQVRFPHEKTPDPTTPWGDFNTRGDVRALLERHGWTLFERDGDCERWTRPGREKPGTSASLFNGKVFYCFSTNAEPLEADKAYSPFALYAALEHDGDVDAAAQALAEAGYGKQAPSLDEAKRTVYQAIEAAKTDKSAPFKPEVVEAIVALQAKDSAGWQAARDKLKKAGVRVGELDKEIKKRISALKSRKPGVARFVVKDGVICEIKPTKSGVEVVTLCNFNARIVRSECRDDGLDRRTWYVIQGTLANGTPLPEAKVLADDFELMRWVARSWGAQAIIMPDRNVRECLRAAIQILSGQSPVKTIYTHLGWRFVEGLGWIYLHAGGAIGAGGPVDDVLVDPDGRLGDYHLPEPPEGDALAKAVRASIRTLSVAPTQITYPLLAAVYRAPLAEAEPVDLSVFLAGPTGVKKSSVSGVFQAHYGCKFSDRHLPASWTSTANALERLAFLAKDAVLTVDDFAPRGTVNSVNMLHQLADRVLRGQGNRSSRDRMRPDTSLRQGYAPRGLILATGEDIPQGESLRARGLILELKNGDVDLKKLTEAQRDADEGLLAQAMAGYVRWLAPRMDGLKKTLHGRFLELREEVRSHSLSHDRTPSILANLAVGAESFLKYAQDVGALTEEEAKAVWNGGWQALMEAGKNQKTFLQSEDPVGRFMDLIMSALASGRAHVADYETGQTPRVDDPTRWGWRTEFGMPVTPSEFATAVGRTTYQPLGTRIGWMADGELWLDPEAAYAEAQELARRQGTTLPVTQATLWKRMKDRGLLIPEQDGAEMRLKARRVVEGHRRRLVVIPAGFYHNAVQQDVH